jgi:hypothetical protein
MQDVTYNAIIRKIQFSLNLLLHTLMHFQIQKHQQRECYTPIAMVIHGKKIVSTDQLFEN